MSIVNTAVYDKLVEVAKARKLISYVELGRLADISFDTEVGVKILGLVLDIIADQEVQEGRPLLTIVAVGPDNRPDTRFFDYARKARVQQTDDETFFATELKRVYDYWATATKTV